MSNRNPLRTPGGTGGINDIGEVAGAAAQAGGSGWPTAQRRLLRFDQHYLCTGLQGQLLDHPGITEQHPRTAVLKHVRHPLGRVIRIQRHIGTAGLEHCQQRHQQVWAARQGDAHSHLRANPGGDQAMGQAVGPTLELKVAVTLVTVQQRQRIGLCGGLLSDQLVHTEVLTVAWADRVPVMNHALEFSRVEQAQLADALLGRGDHCTQQVQPVPGHALDRFQREQVFGKGQCRLQLPGLFPGVQAQVELSGAPLLFDQAQAQARSSLHRGNVGDHWLVVVHHLKQRVMAQAALQLERFHQALERQLLMCLRP
ncbi:hypothetical protein D3C80_551380 [compost metagenome]